MSPSLPAEIRTYLEDAVVQTGSAAYLLFDGDFRVREAGGDLGRFGLADIPIGEPPGDDVPYLHGLLPLDAERLVLHNLQVGDRSMHLHLTDRWALMLDASDDIARELRLRQSVNQLALSEERVRRLERELDHGGREAELLGGVFHVRHVVVLEMREDGLVDAIGRPPAWFSKLFADRADYRRLNPWGRFPILEHFLEDARTHWASGADGLIRSGMWYDRSATGDELHLEATALLTGDRRVLLVESLGEKHEERQALVQRAREARLESRQRIVEQESLVTQKTEQLLETIDELNREAAERQEATARLIESQRRLRALAVQLASAEEDERRRIAAGLHDDLGQLLAVAKMRLGVLRLKTPAEHAGALDEIEDVIGQAVQSTRTMTFELGSPVLHEEGLVPAVEDLVERIDGDGGVSVELDAPAGLETPLDPQLRTVLFQAIRELAHNVVKHANATGIVIRIASERGFVRIDVEDDGDGFDPRVIGPSAETNSGYGLFSIRERLESLGGRLEIESRAGDGTTMRLIAPLLPE